MAFVDLAARFIADPKFGSRLSESLLIEIGDDETWLFEPGPPRNATKISGREVEHKTKIYISRKGLERLLGGESTPQILHQQGELTYSGSPIVVRHFSELLS